MEGNLQGRACACFPLLPPPFHDARHESHMRDLARRARDLRARRISPLARDHDPTKGARPPCDMRPALAALYIHCFRPCADRARGDHRPAGAGSRGHGRGAPSGGRRSCLLRWRSPKPSASRRSSRTALRYKEMMRKYGRSTEQRSSPSRCDPGDRAHAQARWPESDIGLRRGSRESCGCARVQPPIHRKNVLITPPFPHALPQQETERAKVSHAAGPASPPPPPPLDPARVLEALNIAKVSISV